MRDQTYRALLIANSTFPRDRDNLPELEGPRNDPAVLRDVLCDDAVGLFASDNIRLVTEREMSEIMAEVEDFLASASARDTLLLYYSGHGVLDETNELYFCARDTRTTRLASSAVGASWVSSRIDRSAAGATVILLDCCHAGAFKGGAVAPPLAGAGRFVVSSVRASELASDTDARNHASIFTSTMADGLRHGVEDLDHDGFVKLTDLYNYVYAKLSTTGRQLPQKRFSGTGDVPMALRPKTRELPSRPPELDVSQERFELGDVWSGDPRPPERFSVINRGGGSLDWRAETTAPWLTLDQDSSGVTMHLHPEVGGNEADVLVHDAATGATKTVHLSVQVHERPPQPSPDGDDGGDGGGNGGEGGGGGPDWRKIGIAAGVAGLVVALLVALVLWRPWDGGSSATSTTTPSTLTPLEVSPGRTSCSADSCATEPITFTVQGVDPNAVTALITYPGGGELTDYRSFKAAGGGRATWTFLARDADAIGEYEVIFDYDGHQSAPQKFSVEPVDGSFSIIQELDAAIVAKDYERARELDDGLTRATDDQIQSEYASPWIRILADPSQISATASVLDGAYVALSISGGEIDWARVDCERWDFHGDGVTARGRPTPQLRFELTEKPLDIDIIRGAVNDRCPATPAPTPSPATTSATTSPTTTTTYTTTTTATTTATTAPSTTAPG